MHYNLTNHYKDGEYFVSCFDKTPVLLSDIVRDLQKSGRIIDRALSFPYIGEPIIYSDVFFHTLTVHQARHFYKMQIHFTDGIVMIIQDTEFFHVLSKDTSFHLEEYLNIRKTPSLETVNLRMDVYKKLKQKFPDICFNVMMHVHKIESSKDCPEEWLQMAHIIDNAQSREDILKVIPDTRPGTICEWKTYIEDNHLSGDTLNSFIYDIVVDRHRLYINETLYDFLLMAFSFGADPNYIHRIDDNYPRYDSILRHVDIYSLRMLFERGADPNLLIGEIDDPNSETVFEFYDSDLAYRSEDETEKMHFPFLCAAYGGHYRNGLNPIELNKGHCLNELKAVENKKYRIRYSEDENENYSISISVIDRKTRHVIGKHIRIF